MRTAVAAAATLLPACDILSPAPDLDVTLAAENVSWWGVTEGEYQRLECSLSIAAAVTGDARARARWGNARLDLYTGLDREQPATTLELDGDQIAQAFGTGEFAPGDDPRLSLDLDGSIPFFGRLHQDYRVVDGGTKTAETTFECGTAGGTGTPPTDLVIAVEDSVPQPGTPLVLELHARADQGVWAMNVSFRGAWTQSVPLYLNQQIGSGTVTETLEVFLPWEVPQGELLEAQLIVTDMVGQVTAGDFQELGVVGDLEPPHVFYTAYYDPAPGSAVHPVASGDSVVIQASLKDASPHRLVYSVGEPELLRDSVLFPPGRHSRSLVFEARSGWEGQHPVTIWAVDSLGRRTDGGLEDLLIYPARTPAVDRVTIDGPVTDARMDPARGVLYLARPDTAILTRLALADLGPLTPIELPAPATAVDLSLSGDSLLLAAADSGAVMVVDPDGVRPTSVVELTTLEPGFLPRGLRVNRNGRWLIQAIRTLRTLVLLEWRAGAGAGSILHTDDSYHVWARVMTSDDRSLTMAAAGCGILPYRAGRLEPCWLTPSADRAAPDADGSRVAMPNKLLGADGEVLRAESPIGPDVRATDLSPDGGTLYLAAGDGIHIVTVADWRPVELLRMPVTQRIMAVSPDGSFAILWGGDEIGPTVEATSVTRVPLVP